MDGNYVQARSIAAWVAKIEAMIRQMTELKAALQGAAVIELKVKPAIAADDEQAAESPAPKPVRRFRGPGKKKRVSAAEVMAAKTKAEQAAPQKEPAVVESVKKRRKSRMSYTRFLQQLTLDYGKLVADRLVHMTGIDKTAYGLRRQLERFLGTFDDQEAAKLGYASAVGHADPKGTPSAEMLADVQELIMHPDGQVSVFCNQDELAKVRLLRRGQPVFQGANDVRRPQARAGKRRAASA